MMTPVLVPLAISYHIDLTHLGIMIVLNSMIGLNTPPVGICLYIVSRIAKVPIMLVVKELIPFYIILIAGLALITFVPEIATFLPKLMCF